MYNFYKKIALLVNEHSIVEVNLLYTVMHNIQLQHVCSKFNIVSIA